MPIWAGDVEEVQSLYGFPVYRSNDGWVESEKRIRFEPDRSASELHDFRVSFQPKESDAEQVFGVRAADGETAKLLVQEAVELFDLPATSVEPFPEESDYWTGTEFEDLRRFGSLPGVWYRDGGEKNIALFFDGTSNSVKAGSDVDGTNVLRLFQALELDSHPNQCATYIPGVGTIPSKKYRIGWARRLRNLMDMAFGTGVKQDVREGYEYLMRHYHPGDRIYIFGFSRGSYSARALTALLDLFGLVKAGRENLVDYAMEYFWRGNRQRKQTDSYFEIASRFKKSFSWEVIVYFAGFWDTVSAIGIFHSLHRLPGTDRLRNVYVAAHAVSIDERRWFYPVAHWDLSLERDIGSNEPRWWDDEVGAWRDKYGEVRPDWATFWFAGDHSDVGGSHPDHTLADISLRFIAGLAMKSSLKVNTNLLPPFNRDGSKGLVHDSWNVLWGPFRRRPVPHEREEDVPEEEKPRPPRLARIHASTLRKAWGEDPGYQERVESGKSPLSDWMESFDDDYKGMYDHTAITWVDNLFDNEWEGAEDMLRSRVTDRMRWESTA